MCVDYRQLNKRIIRKSHTFPRTEEMLDTLSGSKYFFSIRYKIGISPGGNPGEHKCQTAFTVVPLRFSEFNRLPFGLCNALTS